jgi:two-component system phosphate regulon sensor histidine kinase PhoR
MEHGLQALRDFITSDVRSHEAQTRFALRQVVDRAVSSLTEFARSRGVEIVIRDTSHGAEISGQERELQRAFTNLLHNAVKYTWSRAAGRMPWVTIELRASEHGLSVAFENWGVPIKREEIASGKIFELGYRGELSRDRNRLGTGIGLTDVKMVIEAHRGKISVESHPAPSNAAHLGEHDSRYYEQPFITTFVVTLPRA